MSNPVAVIGKVPRMWPKEDKMSVFEQLVALFLARIVDRPPRGLIIGQNLALVAVERVVGKGAEGEQPNQDRDREVSCEHDGPPKVPTVKSIPDLTLAFKREWKRRAFRIDVRVVRHCWCENPFSHPFSAGILSLVSGRTEKGFSVQPRSMNRARSGSDGYCPGEASNCHGATDNLRLRPPPASIPTAWHATAAQCIRIQYPARWRLGLGLAGVQADP